MDYAELLQQVQVAGALDRATAEQPAGERARRCCSPMRALTTSTAPVRVGIARRSGWGWRWARGQVLGASALGRCRPGPGPLPSGRAWSPASAGQASATAGRDMLESLTGAVGPAWLARTAWNEPAKNTSLRPDAPT